MKTATDIDGLIAQLSSQDGSEREQARKKLVKIGKTAVPYLVPLLSERSQHLRWEACKTVGGIKDSGAAAALVNSLSDESVEVRWLAAEGLIALEKKALVPLLRALETKFDSSYVREGAHHILHALEREDLLSKEAKDVLDALRYLEPKASVALAAGKALQSEAG